MSIKLIYHSFKSIHNIISPFDKAIVEIVKNQDIQMATPYLSLNYINRIISLTKSWRLITDIKQLASSHNKSEFEKIKLFISKNNKLIRHINTLHAKVLIGENKAIIGSANFTRNGIIGNIELSVFFDNEPQIFDVKNWFEQLWIASSEINNHNLNSFFSSLSKTSINKTKISVEFDDSFTIKSNFLKINIDKTNLHENNYIKFTNDQDYLSWIKRNPNGFVLNTYKRIDPNYLVLHKANCLWIGKFWRKTKEGAFTENNYAKICSLNLKYLQKFSKEHGRSDGSFSNICKKCNPLR